MYLFRRNFLLDIKVFNKIIFIDHGDVEKNYKNYSLYIFYH